MRDDQHNSDVHRQDVPAEWPLIYPYTAQYADKSKQEIVIIMIYLYMAPYADKSKQEIVIIVIYQ